jgi:hypothetical protein
MDVEAFIAMSHSGIMLAGYPSTSVPLMPLPTSPKQGPGSHRMDEAVRAEHARILLQQLFLFHGQGPCGLYVAATAPAARLAVVPHQERADPGDDVVPLLHAGKFQHEGPRNGGYPHLGLGFGLLQRPCNRGFRGQVETSTLLPPTPPHQSVISWEFSYVWKNEAQSFCTLGCLEAPGVPVACPLHRTSSSWVL